MMNRGFSIWGLILACLHVTTIIHTVSAKNDIFATTAQVDATTAADPSQYYSIDGSFNNINHPSWGQTKTPRVRILPNASRYLDQTAPNIGGGIPVDETNFQLPSARRIMEDIFSQSTPHADKGTNHMMLEFGHFIVQDVIGRTLMNETEPFDMPCDGVVQDVIFCPVTGKSIPFDRASHEAPHPIKPRASLNGETAFLDMSNMYGNTPAIQQEVREFIGGRVLLDEKQMPPILEKYNSSPGVFALYCVFLRYHNKLAAGFQAANPEWTDEQLFQEARHKNIAIYQFIAEEKYIPTLLGSKLKPYAGYDDTVDPSVDEFFAAASFRYAHSSFSGIVRLLDENFDPTGSDPLLLRDVFRQPSPNNVPRVVRNHGGIEPFLRGLTVTTAKAVDASMVHDINYFTEATSLLDVQRGRDVGLPSYNDAREAFGLSRVDSFEDNALLGYDDQAVLTSLKDLYGNDINKLDAYVGALLEAKETGAEMGPLFTMSIKNQFERIRDGDRFWYKTRYPDEWENFPSLWDVINATCPQMQNLPTEAFLSWDGVIAAEGEESCQASTTSLSLINSKYFLGWTFDVPTAAELKAQPDLKTMIEVKMTFKDKMTDAGFISVGWRSQKMKGAEMWWCVIDAGLFNPTSSIEASCDANADKVNFEKKMFSCCVAEGGMHVMPVCSAKTAPVYYPLTVVDWCLTETESMVTVTAPVCEGTVGNNQDVVDCFRTSSQDNGDMEFIVAYNPRLASRGHGYQMRTAAAANLEAGRQTESETGTADEGLIATHAVFMLFGWMVFAPAAVFIARYMKTRPSRLVWHVSLMGIVGSMMVPLLIGVEASVGASDKTQEHSFVGLCLMGFYFVMVFAGRIRYLKLQGQKVGRKTYFFSAILHKYGGVVMVILAWWNCYTGLVRIGPEDSYFQVFLLSSFPLGYNLEIFGFIQTYMFFPYLGVVVLTFIVAEARRYRLNSGSHATKLQGILEGKHTIWEDDADKFLDKMTMDAFMESTKLGTMLCIVDGYVLDITSFVESHPGGQHLLRYAAASDITEEFVGKRDVDGLRHVHSQGAVNLMKTFVKAVLVDNDGHKLSFLKGASSRMAMANSKNGGFGRMSFMETIAKVPQSRRGASVFRRGRVVGLKYLTPDITLNHTAKPVILLQLALPKTRNDLHVQKLISLPSCAFTFRGIDKYNTAVDRQYTPVKINHDYESDYKTDNDEEVFDFVISLVPGGKMTKILLDARVGKVLLAQGPTINQETVTKFRTGGWRSVVLIAAGTGVSPMLQVIDYYIGKMSSEFDGMQSRFQSEVPNMYLMWIVKGPKYNYAETLALDARVERSMGKFKYIVIYSSSKGKKEAEVARNALHHQWTFKELLQNTKPKGKIGFKKPKKVKREVLDAAWEQKKLRSPGLPMKKLAQSIRKQASGMISESEQDPSRSSSAEFSIYNEITEVTWNSKQPFTGYRSYGKPLIEELLLSIPRVNVPARTSSKSNIPLSMPSIVEEGSEEDEHSDQEQLSSEDENSRTSSDRGSFNEKESKGSYEETSSFKDQFSDEGSISIGSRSRSDDSISIDSRSRSLSYSYSGTESYDYLSRITEEESLSGTVTTSSKGKNTSIPGGLSVEKKGETETASTEKNSNAEVPDTISLDKDEVGTVSTERSGSSPESNPQVDLESNYLTSWLPPSRQDRSSWMPPPGLDAAKNASYDSDYVSFDHNRLKNGLSTAPSGAVIYRNPPPKQSQSRIPPRLGSPPPEDSPRIPPRLGSPPPEASRPPVPKSISTDSNEASSVPYARNISVSQNQAPKLRKPSRVPSLEAPSDGSTKKVISEDFDRPALDNRAPSKTVESTKKTDSRRLLPGRDNRVEDMLDQHDMVEEEYRQQRILVAISGAPMFEYNTRMSLSDLGFPKENVVTFHASAQQL